ncbi:hypothetical protein [Egbenema bharatensis]|uniref:hypothetical protein n=1 Tax=Egbenema bharatensis TaxID=3463334 RepID=UPI003A8A835F
MHHDHALQYSFYEYSKQGHPIQLHQFGANRVAAFSAHRHLEQEGRKVGAMINTRMRHRPNLRALATHLFSHASTRARLSHAGMSSEPTKPLTPAT